MLTRYFKAITACVYVCVFLIYSDIWKKRGKTEINRGKKTKHTWWMMEAGNDHQRFNKIWNVTIYDFVCSERTTYALVHEWQYKRVLTCADRGQKATEEMAFLLVHGPSSVVLSGTSKPSTTVTDRPGSFKMGWHVILITWGALLYSGTRTFNQN